MEATGETEGGSYEDLTGITEKKRPKLRIVRSRLSAKIQKKDEAGDMKQSQSASDVTFSWNEHLNIGDILSQGMLGARALSHDSIFQSDPEPPRLLSQENSHGRIRALQMKLQQQNMRLGPPPMVLPIKRPEDPGGSSEDDGLPHSPPENSQGEGVRPASSNKPFGVTGSFYPFSIPLRNHSSLSLAGAGSEEDEQPLSPRLNSHMPISTSTEPPGVDFSSPPQITPCLDNSAARHRMSVKPRNQRASAKMRRFPTLSTSRPRSESVNHLTGPLTEKPEEEVRATKEMTYISSFSSEVLQPVEKFTSPPARNAPPASPRKTQEGTGGAQKAQAQRQSSQQPEQEEADRQTTFTKLGLPQHLTVKQETPSWATVSVPKTRTASVNRPAPDAELDSVEAVTAKAPSSPSPKSMKTRETIRDISSDSTSKSAQENIVLPARPMGLTSRQQLNVKQGELDEPLILNIESKDMVQGQSATLHAKNCLNDQQLAPSRVSADLASVVTLRAANLRRHPFSTQDVSEVERGWQSTTASPTRQVDQPQAESLKQQRQVARSSQPSISSNLQQDQPRTEGILGGLEKTEARKEAVPWARGPLGQAESQRVGVTGKDHHSSPLSEAPRLEMVSKTKSNVPSAPTKPRELLPNSVTAQGREDDQGNETQEMGVEATEEEVQEGVEEAEEANEELKGNELDEEEKEKGGGNAFGVKLRSTSLCLKYRSDLAQSELKVKRHSAEIGALTPPLAPLPASSHSGVSEEQLDTTPSPQRGRSVESMLNKPLSHTGLSPMPPSAQMSSSSPKRTGRDREWLESFRQADKAPPTQPEFLPDKGIRPTPLPQMPVPPKENIAASAPFSKEPQDSTSEVSWMSVAREKTKSLQQLFTSRLPEFTGLQMATRPTATTASQSPPAQPAMRPVQSTAYPPAALHSTTQPSFKPTLSTPNQTLAARPAQPTTETQMSSRAAQISCSQPETAQSNAKQGQLTTNKTSVSQLTSRQAQSITYPMPTHQDIQKSQTAKHQLAQTSTHQTQPFTQSSPLNLTQVPPQTVLHSVQSTIPPQLSSSPKFTYNQVLQNTPQIFPQTTPPAIEYRLHRRDDRPSSDPVRAEQGEREKGNGKASQKGRVPWAAETGSRATHMENLADRAPMGTKVEEPKATSEARITAQSTSPFQTIFSNRCANVEGARASTTISAAVPTRLVDREDRWQRKTGPPSSSPLSSSPLPSNSDGGQPSWMELAKRKSLAWSDKSMD
ncbi:uncharacterized protein KIAA1211-like [Chanos chanos]|uniref:Uncharacterized protein KIAA1211-like n=1 Tax=Chanos chanos TaxID=29144 RepID=A0A6J2WDQ1_CHACN|nr:uncharacterized protein KIAA1211-like [Chanos chanos]XP_030641948.1 uncharacterized protein KIAA1211-like [Chanos chanos]